MKKNFLKTIFAFTIIFLALSCSKNDDSAVTQSTEVHKNLLLKSTDITEGLISTYTYDINNKLINYKFNGNPSNDPRDYNFFYNTDGTLDKFTKASDGSTLYQYTYNSDKKIIKTLTGPYESLFLYNGNEIIINSTNFIDNTRYKSINKYDIKGNYIEGKYYNNVTNVNPNGNLSSTSIYTYDEKNSVNQSIPIEFFYPNTNINNLTSVNVGSYIYSYTYEYNIDNYPTKRTENNGNVTLYEYKRL